MELSIVKTKIEWSCKRGMKELDLLLFPFIESQFNSLSNEQKKHFEQLLQFDDLILFNCFFYHKELENPDLQSLIVLIKQYQQQNVAC